MQLVSSWPSEAGFSVGLDILFQIWLELGYERARGSTDQLDWSFSSLPSLSTLPSFPGGTWDFTEAWCQDAPGSFLGQAQPRPPPNPQGAWPPWRRSTWHPNYSNSFQKTRLNLASWLPPDTDWPCEPCCALENTCKLQSDVVPPWSAWAPRVSPGVTCDTRHCRRGTSRVGRIYNL